MKKYFLYILHCSNDSLYTGITTDIENRMQDHRDGKVSKYVRANLPFKLIYSETHPNRVDASKREYEIKSWSRDKKIAELGLKLD